MLLHLFRAEKLGAERRFSGARRLGWKSREVARFWRYDKSGGGRRQSMSSTLLPRARAAGLRFVAFETEAKYVAIARRRLAAGAS